MQTSSRDTSFPDGLSSRPGASPFFPGAAIVGFSKKLSFLHDVATRVSRGQFIIRRDDFYGVAHRVVQEARRRRQFLSRQSPLFARSGGETGKLAFVE